MARLDVIDPTVIYGILEDDGNRLLSPDAKLVQTKVEAGHSSNKLSKGPAFRLLGLVKTRFDGIYDEEESLDAFKPRLVTLISDGAVLPASSAKTEREALRKAIQTAVDACVIDAPATTDEKLKNLAKLEAIANDTKNKDQNSSFWLTELKACNVPRPKPFNPVGGKKAPEGWTKAVKKHVAKKKLDYQREASGAGKTTGQSAHSVAASKVFAAAHGAAEAYEKAQLQKARDGGGSALRDRLWARAEAKADHNSVYMSKGGTTTNLLGLLDEMRDKNSRLRQQNKWTRRKYEASKYEENNNYAGYCEKGREPTGCYEPVNYLEYCASLPVSEDFKFELDEDGEIV